MSAITTRIPVSLPQKIKEVAKEDGISMNQFFSSAAGEKLSAVLTLAYLRKKAEKANVKDFDNLLKKIPDHNPLDWDQI